ncbi:MAG: adenylate/guanylate cyclase domain-containing protein [Anaerolineales bacterium]
MNRKIHLPWLFHLPTLLIALIAVAMLALTPVWAVRYYRTPFLGMLLEPHGVVSKISGDGWPARSAGAEWPDRLISINGHLLAYDDRPDHWLAEGDYRPVELVFEQRNMGRYSLAVTPVQMPLGSFIELFVVPYLVGTVFLLIGVWAYSLRRNLRSSRALLVFTSAVSITTTTFFDMNTTHHVTALWSVSLPVAATALIYLALVFPRQITLIERWPWVRFIPWFLCLGIAIPAWREVMTPSSALAYITVWQASYAYMALGIAIFLFMLVWHILRSDSPIVRQQSRVIVFGAALAFAPMMIFYLLPTAFSTSPQEFRSAIYFPLLILLPLSITYAILRYRLLDVDRVLGKALIYALTTAAALAAFYGLLNVFSYALRRTITADNPWLIALYLLLLVFGLMPLRNLMQRLIDRLFYRSPADYQRVLNNLATGLVITPDIERTVELLNQQIGLSLAPESFVVYLYDDDQALYLVGGRREGDYPAFDTEHPLVRLLRQAKSALWFPPEATLPLDLAASEEFQRLQCRAFVPLRYEGSLIGFMALGMRRSGDPYSQEDLNFLSTVGGQSTLALENARLFANLRRTLDQTLEMKNLMDDIFASIATGVITTDIQRQITLFNQAAERILGMPVEQVVGKRLPEALPQICQELEEAACGAVERGEVTLGKDVTASIPSRGDLYLRLSCSPLRDAYLGTKGATIVLEDLTERRRLEAEQERIRQTFGRVVAPRIRDRLLSDPSHLRLDGTRQRVTILFADLKGFTGFSEVHDPELIFRVLNDYLSLAAQAILEEEGTLDKFMGDAVMALWNVPDPQEDHALRAVRAALQIIERARQAHLRLSNPDHHLLFRIGVTTGEAMVGNVGTRELFNYTAIGDVVNLAQRLETTAHPGQILIDHATFSLVGRHVVAAPMEPIQVRGRTQPVAVYALQKLK